jgi:hypothetical protein
MPQRVFDLRRALRAGCATTRKQSSQFPQVGLDLVCGHAHHRCASDSAEGIGGKRPSLTAILRECGRFGRRSGRPERILGRAVLRPRLSLRRPQVAPRAPKTQTNELRERALVDRWAGSCGRVLGTQNDLDPCHGVQLGEVRRVRALRVRAVEETLQRHERRRPHRASRHRP